MTDNTNYPRSEGPSVPAQAYATKAKEAVRAADLADKDRERRCVADSPRVCWVLTFHKLTILPKVLIHSLDLPSSFKFSLNSMSSEWATFRIRDEYLERQAKEHPSSQTIFLDFRASPSDSVLDQVLMKLIDLNDVKGVDLATIARLNYSHENPTLDTCKVENIWCRDELATLHLNGPIHISVAVIFRGAWREHRDRWRAPYGGFDLPWTTNLLSDSRELYMTMEALFERLQRRLSPSYDGKAFHQDTSLSDLIGSSWVLRESYRNQFRALMTQKFHNYAVSGSSIYQKYYNTHHKAGEHCDICLQQQAEEPEVSALEGDLPIAACEAISQGISSNSSLAPVQPSRAEERKQGEDSHSHTRMIPARPMIALPVKRPSLSDPEEMWEAYRVSGCPLPRFPGATEQGVANQESAHLDSFDGHQVPQGKPDPSINSPRMCRHLEYLFTKAKDVAQQLETTVQTRPTYAGSVHWIKYIMENLVQPNLDQVAPLLIPRSEVKSTAERPHTQ